MTLLSFPPSRSFPVTQPEPADTPVERGSTVYIGMPMRDAYVALGLDWREASFECVKQARPIEASASTDWCILRVDPRMVSKVAESLSEQGLSVYAPMETYEQRRRTFREGRERIEVVARDRPLLGSYVFALLDTDQALDAARDNKAVREVMCKDGRPVRVPSLVIGSFALAEACHDFDPTWKPPKVKARTPKRGGRRRKVREARFEAKTLVHLKAGPFSGFTGTVLRAARDERIEVLVTLFGRPTEVEIDEQDVEEAA